MAKILLGKPVADAICEDLLPRITALNSAGIAPTLAVVRVGAREDDLSYERGICARCDALGIDVQKFVLDENCTQADIEQTVDRINESPKIHGCLIFRPLPAHLDEARVCKMLAPEKDVDGITPASLYGVFAGERVGFAPCTARACMETLKFYGIELEGTNAVVVGRSLVIGKPISMMLQRANATVTMCHTRTKNLDDICKRADLLVVCAGHANTIGSCATHDRQTILDVGINWSECENKLVGDVAFDEVEPIADAITPVPRGIGSVTTAALAQHTTAAAERTHLRVC